MCDCLLKVLMMARVTISRQQRIGAIVIGATQFGPFEDADQII